MRVVGINDNYTMSVPLEILPLLAGDFDGDTLSIMWIINKDVEIAAEEVFSPRYSMYISRNDGMFNNDINHQKDIIIAGCGLLDMSRRYYTDAELNAIRTAQLMQEDIIPVGDTSVDKINTAIASITRTYNPNNSEVVNDCLAFIAQCKHCSEMFDIAYSEGGNYYGAEQFNGKAGY